VVVHVDADSRGTCFAYQIPLTALKIAFGSQRYNKQTLLSFLYFTSTNDQKVIMIILEEVAERPKDDKFNGLTLRNPQAAYTRSSSLLLPDYDTSEAQHREATIPPSSKFKLDARTWRAVLFALCLYIFLTVTIAVPIIVLASPFLLRNAL
jgi:hypothetical protein